MTSRTIPTLPASSAHRRCASRRSEALWAALADGTIQTVSTDHCSFTLTQKDAGKGDFTKIPGGLPGVETRGILLYSEGVAKGRIPAEKMAEVLAENPAKLYGAFPRKGILQRAATPTSSSSIRPKLDSSPRPTRSRTSIIPRSRASARRGVIEQVYLRGQLAVDHGEVQTGKIGQFIPRGVNSL